MIVLTVQKCLKNGKIAELSVHGRIQMKSKRLVFLACLAVILGMFCACEDDEKAPEDGEIIVPGNTLAEKIDWVSKHGRGIGHVSYILEVSSDEYIGGFSVSAIYPTTVKLIGIGGVRTIERFGSNNGNILISNFSNTLILDENIVLKGFSISIDYGNLIMNNGSKITGSSNRGVDIVRGGTFTMNGGEISGNTADEGGGGVYMLAGTFTMNGGTISGNTAFGGGGVCILGGTFTVIAKI
jgi:hypothetical protein